MHALSFDEFFQTKIAPIYAASIDPERLRRAEAMPWQFLWQFLTILVIGMIVGYFQDLRTGLLVFAGLLLLTELLYLYEYPYPKFDSIGFFVPFFVVLTGIGGFCTLYFGDSPGPYVGGAAMLTGSVLITVVQNPRRAALTRPYESLKGEVVDLFLKQFFPGFQWVAAGSLSASSVDGLGIFSENFDEVNYGDAVEGPLGNHRVLIESLELVRVSRSKNTTTRTTVFRGFMMTTYGGQNPVVIVRPHRGAAFIDAFIVEGHRIEMEDPAFEQHFDVMCTDDFAARRLLSPSLMAKLTQFAAYHPKLYSIRFAYQTVCCVKDEEAFWEDTDYSDMEEVRKDLQSVQLRLDRMLELSLELIQD